MMMNRRTDGGYEFGVDRSIATSRMKRKVRRRFGRKTLHQLRNDANDPDQQSQEKIDDAHTDKHELYAGKYKFAD